MKILVADDSAVSRRLLEAPLKEWGYEVVAVCDGAQALAILQRSDAPSLAVLDWMMPGLTGLEVCRIVRAENRRPYVYILLLTSRNTKEDVIEGMRAGADDYIVKPFDQHELEVRLRAGRRILELQAQLLAAQEALREQATKDSLTSLWNHRTILEILDNEIARAERDERPLGLLMIDLDWFKRVNDQHGHLVGDAVLCHVAGCLRKGMRRYDAVGRYGGEEFLAILPGSEESSILAQAERLRALVEESPFSFEQPDGAAVSISLSVSIGGTAIPPGKNIDAITAVRLADEALYVAKRTGKNRCVLRSIESAG